MAKKARELTPIMVRLPEPLRRELARLADAGGRSLNSEIIRRLQESVATDSPLSPDANRVINRFEARVAEKLFGRIQKNMDEQNKLITDLLRRGLKEQGEDK
jgi:hypothetical protein